MPVPKMTVINFPRKAQRIDVAKGRITVPGILMIGTTKRSSCSE